MDIPYQKYDYYYMFQIVELDGQYLRVLNHFDTITKVVKPATEISEKLAVASFSMKFHGKDSFKNLR